MQEADLQVFIDAAQSYFSQTSSTEAEVGTPYLLDSQEDSLILDHTGIVGVSGKRKGMVYFTTPRQMLASLLHELGETDTTEAILLDMAGEIANTIAGNARGTFGKDFLISVPLVVAGHSQQIHALSRESTFVIPITWRATSSYLVICLE